jgi:hypothetical protein
VQVVVVVGEHPDNARRPDEPRARPDEDHFGSGGHEAVDQVLRKSQVCLARLERGTLSPVPARVVHVHVEAVLVRDMAGPAELGTEVAPARTAQIADADARRTGVVRCVLPDHA